MPKKIILLDFDDTIETEKDKQLVLNDDLVKALKKAQDDGAVILGYTNWYSLNYSLGSPGRLHISNKLQAEGINLKAIVTTWTFLDVYKHIATRKKPEQSHQDYIDSLDEKAKYELLNDLYLNKIAPLEKDYSYNMGKDAHLSSEMSKIEGELKPLREAAKTDMKLAIQLPAEAQFNGGKEEMARVVLAVLGKEYHYIAFDDKSEVSHVLDALAKEEKVSAQGFCVQRMKQVQAGAQNAQERFSYQDAIDKPEFVKKQIKMQNFTDATIASITNIMTRIVPQKKFLLFENKEDATMLHYLGELKNTLETLNKKPGTAIIQSMSLLTEKLNGFAETNKDRLEHFGIKAETIKKLHDDIINTITSQKEALPSVSQQDTPIRHI